MRVTLLSPLLLAGCITVGGAVDSRSEGDQARDRALAVFVDRTVTDRINGSEGDNTDWKYIDIVDPGHLRVTVSIDNPGSLKGGELSLHDEFGERLERRLVMDGQVSYVFEVDVEKVPHKYFVRVFTKEGTSVYTVGSRLAYAPPPKPPEPVFADEPEPEPVVAAPAPVKRKVRKRRPRPRPAPKPKPEPVAAPSVVKGKVVRVIPGDGYVKLSIRLSADAPVKKGASGTVLKNGSPMDEPLQVLKVSGRSVTARVNAPPGHFSGKLTVSIRVQ